MTSRRKIEANRHNAQKGPGPRTVSGKSRSLMNARKHGFSIPIMADPEIQATALQIARSIVGEHASNELMNQALIVAETELELQRVRQSRLEAITLGMSKNDVKYPHSSNTEDISSPHQTDARVDVKVVMTDAFIRHLPFLRKIERYERRAYSRRNKAITRLNDLQLISG